MALRILCSSVRRSGGSLRALCAPVVQVLDASLPGTLQEAQRPGGVAQGAGGSLWALQWGQAHGKKTLPKKLSESLESELEHEEQNYQPEEVLKSGPPGGFTIKSDSLDEGKTVLFKKHGEEEITVEAVFTQQPAPEPENPDDEESSLAHRVVFNAKVQKGQEVLNFELESDGSYLDIVHAGLEEAGKEPPMAAYTGPEFAELDEKVQDNFETWMEERGLDAQLGDYMIQLVNDREIQAYKRWLKDVNAFIMK